MIAAEPRFDEQTLTYEALKTNVTIIIAEIAVLSRLSLTISVGDCGGKQPGVAQLFASTKLIRSSTDC